MKNASAVQGIKVNFDPRLFSSKIRSLKSNGFQEYLNTVDRGGDYDGYDHVIMTNTMKDHIYSDWVCDLYSNGKNAFLIYSTQS